MVTTPTENTVFSDDHLRAGPGDIQRIQSLTEMRGLYVVPRTENTVSHEIRGLGVATYREYSQ